MGRQERRSNGHATPGIAASDRIISVYLVRTDALPEPRERSGLSWPSWRFFSSRSSARSGSS